MDAIEKLRMIQAFEALMEMDMVVEHTWSQCTGGPFMSRAVVVLGPTRGGTSAVAGVLHHLGIRMQGLRRLVGPANPLGTFEDSEWLGVAMERPDVRKLESCHGMQYAGLIRARNARLPVWGIKEPRLAFCLPEIMPLFEDVRFVVVERDRDATRASYAEWEKEVAAPSLDEQYDAIAEVLVLVAKTHQVHFVRYERLVEDTRATVDNLRRFAYHGLDIKSALWSVERAVESIDPTRRHF